ncbi:MAG: AraC family transcriptional regulator [Sphaerochaetaceae bacterium]|nr:AraC family transcriptional regulator [Sphaerochaetaceae bacterium]
MNNKVSRIKKIFYFRDKKVYKIFLPFIITFCIILLILATSFYSLFTNFAIKLITEDYNSSLSMVSTYYRQLRFSTIPLLDDLFDDENIKEYLFATENKKQAMVNCYTTLENAVARNSYIHSVYLYNKEYGFYSSLTGDENIESLSDTTLINFLEQKPRNQYLYLRQSTFDTQWDTFSIKKIPTETTNLYTICRNSYDRNGILIHGIILNLSESAARELFTDDGQLKGSNLYIVDNDNLFISHPNPDMFGKSANGSPLFEKTINLIDKKGSKIISDDNNNKYLSCWYEDIHMNWKLFYLVPMEYLLEHMRMLRTKMLLISFFLFIISLILIFLESVRANREITRTNRIRNYIFGQMINRANFIFSPESLMDVALLYIDFDQDNEKIKNQTFLTYYNQLQASFKSNNKNCFLIHTETNLFLYFNFKIDPKFQSKIEKIQIDLKNDINNSASILISDVTISFEDLPEKYFKLKENLLSKTIDRTGFCTVQSEEKKEVQDTLNFKDFYLIEKAIAEKSVCNYNKAIIKIVEKLKCTHNYELFCSIKIQLIHVILEQNKEIFNKINDFDQNLWKQSILRCKTYDSLQTALLEITDILDQYSSLSSNDHINELVQIMKKIVEDYLFDFNLSSTLIAEKANLSLGYARNLFKNYEGISLNDYFGHLRIEKACQLLTETNQSINEIRQYVGFNNYSYFCTYFKKIKGISPSLFRQKNNKYCN